MIIKTPNGPILNGVRISKGIYPYKPHVLFAQLQPLIIDYSEYNMKVYYERIFKNRTLSNKTYIDKYPSIEELETDIYGDCRFNLELKIETIPFKEVYARLDKEEFFHKINEMIEEHGNMIVGDLGLGEGNLCVKSNKPFKLGDFLENLKVELNE